jgi:hypothetical protein
MQRKQVRLVSSHLFPSTTRRAACPFEDRPPDALPAAAATAVGAGGAGDLDQRGGVLGDDRPQVAAVHAKREVLRHRDAEQVAVAEDLPGLDRLDVPVDLERDRNRFERLAVEPVCLGWL